MTDLNLTEALQASCLEFDPTINGALYARKEGNVIDVTGGLTSQHTHAELADHLMKALLELSPQSVPTINITVKKSGLTVTTTEKEGTTTVTSAAEVAILDEVNVLFQGDLPLSAIQLNNEYKRENWNTFRKVEACVAVVGFIAPIVIDSQFKIIDGDLRYSIAKSLQWTQVPVIMIDGDSQRTDFLRLALNRSAEFQRWKYDEVDTYLDEVPVSLPLLEPLGFFGERVLPESFFGQTVLDYEIHEEFQSQQDFYKQEYGLAKWAEIQRERIAKEHEAKKAKKVKKPTANTMSLFDLNATVKEEDYLETYDIEKEKAEHVEKMKEVAGTITDNYDIKRKAEKEARGQAWQTSRRAPKQVIADLKASVETEEVSEEA